MVEQNRHLLLLDSGREYRPPPVGFEGCAGYWFFAAMRG